MAKKKAVVIGPVPGSLLEVNAQIARIGELDRKYTLAETKRDEEIAAVKRKYENELSDIARSLASETANIGRGGK